MNLLKAEEGKEYIIRQLETNDEELDSFLFSLGCYSGEPITVISHLKGGCIVSIKDGRYSIDKALAAAIAVNEGRILRFSRLVKIVTSEKGDAPLFIWNIVRVI